MANQAYNADEARNALRGALSQNDNIIDKFNNAVKTLQGAYASDGASVGGNLGEAAGNSFADSAGVEFSKGLQVKTEEFLRDRVPELLAKMDEFKSATETAYSSANQETGAQR